MIQTVGIITLCPVVTGWWFAASPFELFLNGIHMTYAKLIKWQFMSLAYVICMPFKNSMILFINNNAM